MKKVMVRRCPVWRHPSKGMPPVCGSAAKGARVEVEVSDGNRGQFTVLLDGRVIAEKGESLPEIEQVVAAVRNATPAHSR